jgi:hypothetical protein
MDTNAHESMKKRWHAECLGKKFFSGPTKNTHVVSSISAIQKLPYSCAFVSIRGFSSVLKQSATATVTKVPNVIRQGNASTNGF